ncbi:unnamed protein product [Closterium sp. Naga37s-1]|nr:unnamed protein product [Closterium sp. Naga37s-1]
MAHPADIPVLPKGHRSRPALDTVITNGVVSPPAEEQQSGKAVVNNETHSAAVNEATTASVAGSSGLTTAEKAAMSSATLTDIDGFLDDDSDDEMVIDLVKEADFRLRSVAILLILFMLKKEVASASLKASPLFLPILRDPAIALISTGSSREEWICTQVGCGKAKGKSLMAAADHISPAAHLQQLAKAGSATKESLDKINLTVIRKEYGL